MESDFVELSLACASQDEANKIANRLLELKLVACAKFLPIDSCYWWGDKIVDDKEALLLMESAAVNFGRIEAEVAKLHSYDTFVLEQYKVDKISSRAAGWLAKLLNN